MLNGREGSAQSRYGLGEIPPYVQYTSPVEPLNTPNAGGSKLPLNLIAVIVGHLDDIADLARVTRTSRLLYYMTLPLLYDRVTLHSYPEIRYINGRPEGFGSGSPFTMALNGLVTRPHAQLVQDFRIWGQWREVGIEEFTLGRVPDNTMMLNVLLRAATDRMTKLRSLAWELDCKPLKTVYQGLAARSTLTSLTLKFPSTRVPRPSVLIPPIPNLRYFKAVDIDPLCYPDDISMLILHGRKLEDLRLHFSPRFRREAEPGLSLDTYFGRLQRANLALPVRHFAIQNFFGVYGHLLDAIIDDQVCKSTCFIDTFGDASGNAKNVFVDETWKSVPADLKTDFRRVRFNELSLQHVTLLSRATGMEKLYCINARHPKTGDTPVAHTSPITPSDNGSPDSDSAGLQLGREYLHAITRKHGATMKHLLLSDRWCFNQDDTADIVRYCPNLEQLGIALNTTNHSTMRLLMPFLSKLKAIRVLPNQWEADEVRNHPSEERMEGLRNDMWKAGAENLEWIGFGNEVYQVGKHYSILNEEGLMEMRREITWASAEDVKHVEIWSMDVLNIDADPVAPFLP